MLFRSRRSFAKYVLWQYAMSQGGEEQELDHELYADCQVDHILPDEPSTFDVTTFGFPADEDYESTKHSLGNLTLLESALNGRALNRPPTEKTSHYAQSRLHSTRVLGARITEAGFTSDAQRKRLDELVRFFKEHWPIPRPTP